MVYVVRIGYLRSLVKLFEACLRLKFYRMFVVLILVFMFGEGGIKKK